MKLRELLQGAGALALVGVAGGTAANVGSAETSIPAEIAAGPHCRVANLPAQVMSPEAVKAYEDAEPPLWNDLGSLSYPVTTKSKEAQSYFDQGLRMATNFNHAEARRAFRKAQRLDPTCAMCFARRGTCARAQHQRADGSGSECAGRCRAAQGADALQQARARRRRD